MRNYVSQASSGLRNFLTAALSLFVDEEPSSQLLCAVSAAEQSRLFRNFLAIVLTNELYLRNNKGKRTSFLLSSCLLLESANSFQRADLKENYLLSLKQQLHGSLMQSGKGCTYLATISSSVTEFSNSRCSDCSSSWLLSITLHNFWKKTIIQTIVITTHFTITSIQFNFVENDLWF